MALADCRPLTNSMIRYSTICAAVGLLSYLMFAKSGSVMPERYVHADGGVYRGQWQGGKKQGMGVYTYPGGGRYEGRWIDNLKDGIGVYHFPKVRYDSVWTPAQRCWIVRLQGPCLAVTVA